MLFVSFPAFIPPTSLQMTIFPAHTLNNLSTTMMATDNPRIKANTHLKQRVAVLPASWLLVNEEKMLERVECSRTF